MSATITAPTREEPQAPPPRPATASSAVIRPFTAWFFVSMLIYQSFHLLEHTIETVQLEILHHAKAHTLLGGVNFEYVHFVGNVLLEYGLIALAVSAGARARARLKVEHALGWYAMAAALLIQATHVFDHTVRIFEYIQSGGAVPKGTLTIWINPVWFHFSTNLMVLTAMFVAFFGMKVHQALFPVADASSWPPPSRAETPAPLPG